jgi:hypothetical protein
MPYLALIWDSIMAVNDYALWKIEFAQKTYPLSALVPWRSDKKSIEQVVVETFGEAINILSTGMERLIIEAEANIIALDALEERLSTLHDIISREDSTLSLEKENLLENFGTILGFNRDELRNFDQSLLLLKELKTYRQQAVADGEKQLQMHTNLGIYTSTIKKHCCRSIRIWEYTPVQSRNTAADQYKSGNIHQSNQQTQLQINTYLGIYTSTIKKNSCRSIQI